MSRYSRTVPGATNGASADVVLGQADFQSNSADQGGTATASTLHAPIGVLVANNKLLVADSSNDRVLIWNTIPTTNNTPADVVIGQTDMTSETGGTSATKIDNPRDLFYDQATGKLFISLAAGNHRVLIFNHIPTTNGEAASVVIGQTDFVSNSTGTTASKFNSPWGVRVVQGKLYIIDLINNRTLVWNTIPTTNGASADLVIGQSTLTSVSADQGLSDPTAYTLQNPRAIHSDGRRLYITDSGNNRLLIYNSLPTANNHAADIVVGQPDFASDASNQGGSAGANTLSAPIGMLTIGNKLIVNDASNNRVLIFENIPDAPKAIFTSSPIQQPDGRMRFQGDVSLSGGRHSIWKIEASTNGGPFGQVTSLTDTVRTNPGIPDDIIAKFYHDVTPWENDNSTQDKWTQDIGYTVRFKVYSTNVDLADPFFYFTPFTLNAKSSMLNAPNPQITFSVNQRQINLLKDNLDHYEVWVLPNAKGQMLNDWDKYIDQIPISYDLARDKEDNLLKILDNTLPEGGNGIYENGNLKVTYTNDSASIEVSSKLSSLTPGTYQIKVAAVDKYGYSQETLPQELVIPDPFPYHVNPKKPRVKSVFVESTPSPSTSLRTSEAELPRPAPMPYPSLIPKPYWLDPVSDFLNALIH